MLRQFRIAAAVLMTIASTDLAQGSAPPSTSAICIEHAGESDKPVHGISIGESDIGIESCREDSVERVGLANLWERVVDSKLELRLVATVEETPSDEGGHPHEFGTLFVVIVKGNNRHVLVLNRAHGVMLLAELERFCTDRTLRSYLAHLRNQITDSSPK
jgi:hypothetical protein